MNKPYKTVAEFIANKQNATPVKSFSKEPMLEHITQLLNDIIKKSGKHSPFIEDWTEHSKLAQTLINKTDEELEYALPNKAYILGDNKGFCYMTGKGGMIRFIQNLRGVSK